MQMISAKASKIDLIRQFSKLTPKQIVDTGYPTIAEIARSESVETTEKFLAIILHDLSATFDGELTKDAVIELSAEISSSLLKNLSLEDIYFVTRLLKNTEIYGKININKVMIALNKQLDVRSTLIANKNYNNHLSTKPPRGKSNVEKEKEKLRAAKRWHISNHVKPK